MRTWIFVLLALTWILAGGAAAQDTPSTNPSATLTAYQCTFDGETNQSSIRASLIGADGLALPRDAYTVSITTLQTGDVVPPAQIETTVIPERPPLDMILVLDTTDTMEIESVVNAIRSELVPQLQVQDRVALITFASDVAPRTQFYTDKNRLINEHMLDLLPGQGDNRLYDAIFEAVTEFPVNTDTRQIVVVLTDSNRRDLEQTPLSDIIDRAERETVQVYSVGISSLADQPDIPELVQLGEATGGYTWVLDPEIVTRATIEDGVGDILDEAVRTLASEILIRVDLAGLSPDANGFIGYEITVATSNDATLVDTIACPVEELFHFIRFEEDLPEGTVSGPVDIAVEFESDLPSDDVVVSFIVDGEVAEENNTGVFRFNQPPRQPGYYTIGAQLRSRSGETLATTDRAIEYYVRPEVNLDVGGGYFGELEGEVSFEAQAADPAFELAPVEFTIAPQQDPTQRRPLSEEAIPFVNGVAVLTVDDIAARVQNLFPETDAERFVVQAIVPGAAATDPETTTLFEVFVPQPEPEPIRPVFNWNSIFWALFTILVLINVLLFRSVARARVRYRINHPDNTEMSAQLMTVTVRREGIKQAHSLTKKTITVGRGSSNDINLGDDPNISRNHAVIMWRNGAWYYSNRKRRAMARINGKRRIGFVWQKLVPVSELEIGNALLVFHSSAQQDVSEFIKTNI